MTIEMPKSYCSTCDAFSFVIDGTLTCCGEPIIEPSLSGKPHAKALTAAWLASRRKKSVGNKPRR